MSDVARKIYGKKTELQHLCGLIKNLINFQNDVREAQYGKYRPDSDQERTPRE